MDVYTSSKVSAHTHTFTLADTSFASPPAAGISADTSNDGMHTHSVTISTDQLSMVGAGQSVQITCSLVSGHTHVFTFVKIA